jgi:hypothetical protein
MFIFIFIRGIRILSALGLAALITLGVAHAQGKEPIKIGWLSSLTGAAVIGGHRREQGRGVWRGEDQEETVKRLVRNLRNDAPLTNCCRNRQGKRISRAWNCFLTKSMLGSLRMP